MIHSTYVANFTNAFFSLWKNYKIELPFNFTFQKSIFTIVHAWWGSGWISHKLEIDASSHFPRGCFCQADDGGQKPNANTDLPQLQSDTTVDVNLIRHVSIMTCKEA